jgi:hypothetical protein
MVSTSPLSIRMPTRFYRGYTYFWHEDGIKLPLKGEATKHFAKEDEAKAYIDSLTAPSVPVTSKIQESRPNSAWLIGLFGLVSSFLIVSLFLFSWSPNPLRSTATISGSTSGTSPSAAVQSATGNNGENILGGIAPASRPAPNPPPGQRFWVSPQ